MNKFGDFGDKYTRDFVRKIRFVLFKVVFLYLLRHPDCCAVVIGIRIQSHGLSTTKGTKRQSESRRITDWPIVTLNHFSLGWSLRSLYLTQSSPATIERH